ncbi:MAG: TonB-dependent receptor [Rhodothermaceae bacterium]|nr:TonB-dependent receptor [Rhodothermaceae bacterium]
MLKFRNILLGLVLPACIGLSSMELHAQNTVHGHILDALTGEPLAAASVTVLGTNTGTTTDNQGHFELVLPDGNYRLRISFVGYTSTEMTLSLQPASRAPLTIHLLPAVIAVDEVVVQGAAPRINDPAASSHHLKATEDLLDRVPGADFIQRANFAWEPVVRGLSGGQVGLVIDGIKVIGACVDKMDPSTTDVVVEKFEKIEKTKCGFDQTQSSQIGGTINLITQKPRFDQPLYADAELSYGSVAALRQGRVSGGLTRGNTSVRGSFSYKEAGNFSPGGAEPIPNSGFKKNNYKFDLSQRIGSRHELTASYLGDNAWDVGYPVLLMDAALAKAKIYSLTHTWRPDTHFIPRWETKVYFNRVDHWMSDFKRDVRERTVMRAMNMPMFGKTRTTGALSKLELEHNAYRLEVTLDAYETKSFGDMWMFSVFEDIPDMYLLNLGDVRVRHGAIAADFITPLRTGLTARLGLRLDHSPRTVQRDEALAVLQGRWGVGDLAQSYTLGNVSLSLTQELGFGGRLRLSLANVGRLPTHVENYGHYVYNYVDGYFYTGNPNLKPERSTQVELGFEKWTSKVGIRASIFSNHVRHYIGGRNDADLLGNTSALRFRTYYNSSAAFLTGGEASIVVVLREWLELTGTASYTHGQNLELDEPMYLIPPHTGWTSLRAMRNKWRGDLEARMAMPQNRVARIFADEDGTDGYFVVNVRGGTTLGPGIDLSAGIDNLFDVNYHEHLSFGNLPNPGRNFYLTLSYSI